MVTPARDLLSVIHSQITAKPFAAMDSCLGALQTAELSMDPKQRLNSVKLYCRAALAAAGVPDALEVTDPINFTFSRSHSPATKKQLAVFLVRLINSYPDFLKVPEASVRASELFDETLSESVYRIAKVDRKDQTFIKVNALRKLLEDLENEFQDLVTG